MSEDYNNQDQTQGSFDHQSEDAGRTVRKNKSDNRNFFVIILVILLFLIVLVPTAAIIYLQFDTSEDQALTTTTSSSVVETTKESNTNNSKDETSNSSSDEKMSSDSKDGTDSSNSATGSTNSTATTESSQSEVTRATTESFEDVEVPVGQAGVPQPEEEVASQVAAGAENQTIAEVPQTVTSPEMNNPVESVDPNAVNQQDWNATDNQQNWGAPANDVGAEYVTFGEGSNISFWRIGYMYGVELDQLYALNPGVTPANVEYGQAIRIR